MATKKVEEDKEKKVSNKPKNSSKKKNNSEKKSVEKKESSVKKTKVKDEIKTVEMVEKENIIKEEVKDVEDIDDYDDDFEEYDDEDEIVVENKIEREKKKANKEKVEEAKKEFVKEKEQKVKSAKSDKKKKKRNNSVVGDTFIEQNRDFFSLIKILVSIVVILGIVYLVASFINGDLKKKDESDTDKVDDAVPGIQNEKVLVSSIFDLAEDDYYVLLYDGDSEWASYYAMIYSDYKSVGDDDMKPIYWVDLDDKLNSDFVVKDGEDTNKYAQSVSELKLKSPTLIDMHDGINYKYYEGDEAIETLKEIIDEHKDSENE